jgi:hypothetical protein
MGEPTKLTGVSHENANVITRFFAVFLSNQDFSFFDFHLPHRDVFRGVVRDLKHISADKVNREIHFTCLVCFFQMT